MKDTRSIEAQVAELTQEQRDTIVKADFIAGILSVIGVIPAVVLIIRGIITFQDISLSLEAAQKVTNITLIAALVGLVYIIGVFVFVKIKIPYYSFKKCNYIKKCRRNQKKNDQ